MKGDDDDRDVQASERMKFMFRIYDMDQDGFISNGELFLVKNLLSSYF